MLTINMVDLSDVQQHSEMTETVAFPDSVVIPGLAPSVSASKVD